jgi:hypothetical protein
MPKLLKIAQVYRLVGLALEQLRHRRPQRGRDLAGLCEVKQAIFNWANQAAGKLEPFRRQQNGDVESPFVVGDVPPAT